MAKKQWSDMTKKEKRNGIVGLVIIAIVALVIISAITTKSPKTDVSNTSETTTTPPTTTKTSSKSTTATTSTTQSTKSTATTSKTNTPQRQVKGTAVTLGAGTFTGGTDVANGLYDVTAGSGQSGNFSVTGTDSYNEILGPNDPSLDQVSMIRVQISAGDQISISGLSSVTFTPVTTPFATAQTTENLYSGTWVVGQDIASGRYVVTPGAGQSGNFSTSGQSDYNEILGSDSSLDEVPSVTATLYKGDVIAISGMSQVTFTPSN